MKFTAKKSLGQHFLLNPSTIEKLLKLANIQSHDHVLEIGPGPGVMTTALASKVQQLIAIEKDRDFAKLLKDKFSENSKVIILEGDFLALDLLKTFSTEEGKWKVVANLPYNIATEAIFHLLEFNQLFDSFYLMVQKEVALRLVAKPGSKDYGILSVFSQLFSENKIVMTLPPGAFTPPPKVDSAIVAFRVSEGCRFTIHNLPKFESIVRAAFAQRRKMIQNTLKRALPQHSEGSINSAMDSAGIDPTVRAETVPIEKFVRLSNELSAINPN